MTPSVLLSKLVPIVKASQASRYSSAYIDGFVTRMRPQLEAMLAGYLARKAERQARRAAATPSPLRAAILDIEDPFEHWTPAKRTTANLAAMRILASKEPRSMTAEDRTSLSGYSGWGGLSIDAVRSQFPVGVAPESLALNEYYTPKIVCDAIAEALCPLLPGIAVDGVVKALEPSAGIGRLIRAVSTKPCHVQLDWTAIEFSAVSAKLLAALRPDITVFHGPFEQWVQQNFAREHGRFRLVVSNPPYGKRGVSVIDDEDRSYREDEAAAYFMRRGLDLLGAGGLGVYIVPAGILTGSTNAGLRGKILRKHHLVEAFRLPTASPAGRALFPGAMLVVDVLIFRARGGMLSSVDPHDKFIVEGRYYEEYPQNVLGVLTPDRRGHGRDIVVGEFTGLPAITERQLCSACDVKPVPQVDEPAARVPRSRSTGIVRRIEASTEGLDPALANAVQLGIRVDAYLADLANDDPERPAALWLELHEALLALSNPWQDLKLRNLADGGNVGAQRLLAAFERSGELIKPLRTKPHVERRFSGRPDDIVGQADMLYRSARRLTLDQLVVFHTTLGGFLSRERILTTMLAAGWQRDGENWDVLVPHDVYFTGDLWPKYDNTASRPEDPQAQRQAQALLTAIAPVMFEDIDEHISPRDSWIPLDVISGWMQATINRRESVQLVRENGLVLPRSVSLIDITETSKLKRDEANLARKLDELDKAATRQERASLKQSISNLRAKIREADEGASSSLSAEVVWALGWINHDMTTFKPPHGKDELVDDVRISYAREWQSSFKGWLARAPQRRDQIRDVYNRTFKGFVEPVYDSAPLDIARMGPAAPALKPWQIKGARRVLANRGGLVAFDVGVGKSFTGVAIVAKARQEGWARRPVILVPTSIVWQWEKNIRALLPDYRIGVIGSKRKVLQRGDRFKEASAQLARGLITQEEFQRKITTSENDTPEERAATWTGLQSGQYDVVLLTFDALQRTRMNAEAVMAYAKHTTAIQRSVEIQQRNQEGKKKLTERQKAVQEHGIGGWVAQRMEIVEGWEYDPGIAWDQIGIDLLVVDEAAAFKNLYMPEPREFGLPKFMGNAGDGSKRAWQLDFRIAAIHARTGGSGIVLLTATPAKNSPLEYYNIIQYIDRRAFAELGIHDPEQFIDRYLKISTRQVISITGDVAKRSAVDGFLHLDELRSVIRRYGEFETATNLNDTYSAVVDGKRVPIFPLPELSVPKCSVELDDAQEAKYAELVARMEQMIEDKEMGGILGLLARLSLIAVHSEMDEGYGWNTALHGGVSKRTIPETSLDNWLSRGWKLTKSPLKNTPEEQDGEEDEGEDDTIAKVDKVTVYRELPKPNYHSPKFDAVAGHVVTSTDCGHIIFVENVAAHQWIREVLVERGVKREEIAILNAIATKQSAERQRIAEDFNAGKYRVVIANSVAYEGIDLQQRTCAIHHVDFPWTPADLEQRNGRGYRQGNKQPVIKIVYYFAERSLDGFRYDSIANKAKWQDELIWGKARETNNPGAQLNLTPDQILIMISRNPARTRAVLEKVKQEAENEARAQVAKQAARTLSQANARMVEARATDDHGMAARLRGEAEQKLVDVQKFDPLAWPWARWTNQIRQVEYMVPPDGQAPVFEGLRVAKPNYLDAAQTDFFEFGRLITDHGEPTIGLRPRGAARWTDRTLQNVVNLALTPPMLDIGAASWPDDDGVTASNIRAELNKLKERRQFTWPALGWQHASDAWISRWWERFGKEITQAIVDSTEDEDWTYPVSNGGLSILTKAELDEHAEQGEVKLLPPTIAGFDRFMSMAPGSKRTFTDLDICSRFWWVRPFPRGLLTAVARAAKDEGGSLPTIETLRHRRNRGWP